MAFFAIQSKGELSKWCRPLVRKLNLTTSADKAELETLRAESENVFELSFQDLKNKVHRIVEGQLVSINRKSNLKVQILELAVEKRWTYEETMRALHELAPSLRKRILAEFASEE
jgi:hypothetical protein